LAKHAPIKNLAQIGKHKYLAKKDSVFPFLLLWLIVGFLSSSQMSISTLKLIFSALGRREYET
jgi:hypothetical protein